MKKSSPTNKKKDVPSAVSKYFIFLTCLEYMNEDVDRMTFETEMRQMMRELVEPIIVKGKNDREMILKL